MVSVGMWRTAAGLLVSAAIVGAVIVARRPSGDVGYVEIKTVPAAPVTQAALYLDSKRLAPIRQGTALIRERVGTLKLQADAFGGARAPLCDIEVKKDRITSVTISVLERPPRCVCRFAAGGGTPDRTCVS
jgi:hypothetical protein